MILFFHIENGRVNWAIPLLIFVATSVLPSLLNLPFGNGPAVVFPPPPPPARAPPPYGGDEYETHWFWTPLSCLLGVVVPALVFFGTFNLLYEAQTRGWLARLLQWLDRNVPGFRQAARWLQEPGPGVGTHPRHPRATYEQRFAKVTRAILACPTEVYKTREDLTSLSSQQLRKLIQERGLDDSSAFEKQHLVDILVEAGGSTGDSCSICLDSYESEAVLRRLACGHKFHLECVDKWALSALDYSREPACPACNAPIAGTASKAASR